MLDLVVFFVNLVFVKVLVSMGRNLVHAAQEDALARLAIGLFLALLFVLQPVGPILKRWSFHQRSAFRSDSGAGCLIFYFMPVYFTLMVGLMTAAFILIGEAAAFRATVPEGVAILIVLSGFAWSVVGVALIYRYFTAPKQPPRWRFLMTPGAQRLGDAAVYANVIGLQIVWGIVTASAPFRELVTKTPLGQPGSFTDILGRFVAIGIVAALIYIPGRLFYLVEDKHRRLTYVTMLLANAPMVLPLAFRAPFRP